MFLRGVQKVVPSRGIPVGPMYQWCPQKLPVKNTHHKTACCPIPSQPTVWIWNHLETSRQKNRFLCLQVEGVTWINSWTPRYGSVLVDYMEGSHGKYVMTESQIFPFRSSHSVNKQFIIWLLNVKNLKHSFDNLRNRKILRKKPKQKIVFLVLRC